MLKISPPIKILIIAIKISATIKISPTTTKISHKLIIPT